MGIEAAKAVLEYGFAILRLPHLICLIDPDNIPSVRVATKIGMNFEYEGTDNKGPFLLYSMSCPSLQ